VLAKNFSYPTYIGAFTTTAHSLNLLVTPVGGGPGQQALVEMDFSGNVLRVVTLPMSVDPRWLQYESTSATSFVWRGAKPKSQSPDAVYSINVKSEVKEEGSFDERLRFPARLAGTTWGLTPSGCIRSGDIKEKRVCNLSTADPWGTGFLYRSLSANELVAVEPSTPSLIRLDPDKGQISTRRIVSPEISSALYKRRADPTSAVIIADLIPASSQYLLATVMNQPLAGGAAILKLNLQADVEASYRCPLLSNDGLKVPSNTGGYMLPMMLGYVNSTLFVMDRTGLLSACKLML
jgi:hypothetical protein